MGFHLPNSRDTRRRGKVFRSFSHRSHSLDTLPSAPSLDHNHTFLARRSIRRSSLHRPFLRLTVFALSCHPSLTTTDHSLYSRFDPSSLRTESAFLPFLSTSELQFNSH